MSALTFRYGMGIIDPSSEVLLHWNNPHGPTVCLQKYNGMGCLLDSELLGSGTLL